MSPVIAKNRIGIDLGGSKISAILLDHDSTTREHLRIATPQGDYHATCLAIKDLVARLDHAKEDEPTSVGIGIPGSRSSATGLIRNANSTCLNGKNLQHDLEQIFARPVRLANDADCFTISEATDGAGRGKASVWGVILGTGCGSGLVINGALHTGPLAVAGEWGHNPLPWPTDAELSAATTCWCGRVSCIETWLSGPALSYDHSQATGEHKTAEEIYASAEAGQDCANATLQRHLSRTGRAMAQVINILDPEVIVIGGGLSHMSHLIRDLPGAIAPHLFADHSTLDIRRPHWGADSGVRGAARLWD